MKKIIRVIDLETGPEPTDEDPGIIEVGYTDLISESVDMLGRPYDWRIWYSPAATALVNPGRPIPPETSAIHSLVDADVAHARPWKEIKEILFSTEFLDHQMGQKHEIIAVCGHGIKEAEQALIGKDVPDGIPWICTYKVALHLWPDAPNHKNGTLRYYLNPTGLKRDLAFPPHRALPDSYVTAFTLLQALSLDLGHSVESLIDLTKKPALTARCKIGKDYNNNGKGTPWKDVESSMLRWILGKSFDEDVMYTAQHHLDQREIDQRLEREERDLNRQYADNGMNASFDPQPGRFGPIDTPAAPAADEPKTMELDL